MDKGVQHISGSWTNELGSHVSIEAAGGRLTGTYASSVGDSREEEKLVGFYLPEAEDGRVVIGFVVAWPASRSVTTWSGCYRADCDIMTAFWILREDTSPENAWRATTVGCDVFVRTPPE